MIQALGSSRERQPPAVACALIAAFLWRSVAAAQSDHEPLRHAVHAPAICSNAVPTVFDRVVPDNGLCPTHSAVFETRMPAAPSRYAFGESIAVEVRCCRLPAEDILIAQEVSSRSECPDNSIATGSFYRNLGDQIWGELRCTFINTERYQLSPPARGVAWGMHLKLLQEPRMFQKADLPAAMRYSAGRIARFGWESTGCVGVPPDSMFVGKQFRYCWGLLFRQLQFRGLPGDPPQGTPVPIFPRCRDISSRFDANPTCIPEIE